MDRKSFFAVAQSDNGIDNFKFWPKPVQMTKIHDNETNIYDMRLTQNEDGYIYGVFCSERKDVNQAGDPSAAIAQCGIARTHDLVNWERLADIATSAKQQRNIVLHPEFVDDAYAFYTRGQDAFIDMGQASGIAWGLSKSIRNALIKNEKNVDE